MGKANVSTIGSQKQRQLFVQHLLKDVRALDRMLKEGWFDDDITRIGAEQEVCFVDKNYRPAPISMQVLDKVKGDNFTTELAQFNAEVNLTPLAFEGSCLQKMEQQIN